MAKSKLSVRETIEKSARFLWKNPAAVLPIFIVHMLLVAFVFYYNTYAVVSYSFALVLLTGLAGLYATVLTMHFIYDRRSRKVSLGKVMEKVSVRKMLKLFELSVVMAVAVALLYMIAFAAYVISPMAGGLMILAESVFIMYAALRLVFACNLIVLEGKGVMDSAKGSWKMAKGNMVKLVLLALSVFALTVVVMIAYTTLYESLGLTMMDVSEEGTVVSYPMYVVYYAMISVLSAFYSTVTVEAYVKLRGRRR